LVLNYFGELSRARKEATEAALQVRIPALSTNLHSGIKGDDMEYMEYAILNLGISLFFVVWAILARIPPYGAIPNGLFAIICYILAVTSG